MGNRKAMLKVGEFEKNIREDLRKQAISSSVLLNSFRLIDEDSRKTGAYNDPRYAPFYYYLGKYVEPTNLLEVGFRLGILSGCFLKSCKSVKNFLAFEEQTDDFYSPRLAVKNIRESYDGKIFFESCNVDDPKQQYPFDLDKWDLIIFNQDWNYDKCRSIFDKLWDNLSDDGIIVADCTSKKGTGDALKDLAKIKNREPLFFETRYGTGIIQK